MKKLLISFLILIFAHVSHAQTEVYFNNNSHKLTPRGESALSVLINATQTNGGVFHLIGHADTVGTKIFNLQLSKKRVDRVKTFLIDKGISNSEIYTDYKGESVATKLNQKYNRKVEIIIRPSMEAAKHLDKLQDKFRPKTQGFSFSAENICTLKGEKGTKIIIGPNSLILPNGDLATGKVDYELTEYYDMASFFSEQLHTVSNGVPIESSGMIRIQAFSNGEPLSVKKGKSIEIKMSDTRWGKEGFETFYGKRLPNGNMDWLSETADNNSEENSDLLTLEFGKPEKIVIDKNGLVREIPDSIISVKKKSITLTDKVNNEIRNVISSTNLGYINCDRYIRDRYTSKIGFAIRIENPDISPLHCLLVLDEMNSLLPIRYNYQKKYFTQTYNLSRKKPLKILVLGYNSKTKEKCMYVETIKPRPEILRTIKMSAVSTEEIRKAF